MKIYKYTVHPNQPLEMPERAVIISTSFQGSDLQVWAVVDPTMPKCKRNIQVMATGQDLPEGKFIDTVYLASEGLVFHVFDCGEVE